jgi:O-antigen/teichoic acid export membrane protein
LFIIGLFLAAIAGPQVFGVISLMIVNGAAFIIITDFGTGAAVVWHGAGNDLQRERIFSFAVGAGIVQLLLFFLVELLATRISGKVLLTQQPVNSTSLLNDVLYFTGLIIAEKYTALFYGRARATLANKTLSIVATCFAVIVVLMYIKIITGIEPVLFFSFMTFMLGIGTAVVFHSRIEKIDFARPANQELRSLLTFSAIVFLTNIIQFFAYRLDFWLIDYFYSHSELGIYAQANRFVQLTWVLPTIVASLLTPAIRDRRDPMTEGIFLVLTRLMNLTTVLIVLGILGFACIMYYWFLPTGYSDGLPALIIMLPGYYFFVTTTLLAAWFSAKRLLKINLLGSSICFIVIVVSDLILIPAYSLRGAALANLLAYSITTLYFVMQFKRYTSVQVKNLFLWERKDILLIKTFFARPK